MTSDLHKAFQKLVMAHTDVATAIELLGPHIKGFDHVMLKRLAADVAHFRDVAARLIRDARDADR
jgi:hypothetical protein